MINATFGFQKILKKEKKMLRNVNMKNIKWLKLVKIIDF